MTALYSAARKFGQRQQATAFMAGFCVALRNASMREARSVKKLGASVERIRIHVSAARAHSRDLVRHLQAASAGMPYADYDRERRISATGAFGRVPYNPPAGSIEP